MPDRVRVDGVTVGRIIVHPSRRNGKRLSVALGFKPDRVGIMHLGAKSLDKDR